MNYVVCLRRVEIMKLGLVYGDDDDRGIEKKMTPRRN